MARAKERRDAKGVMRYQGTYRDPAPSGGVVDDGRKLNSCDGEK
jgi:hypothetical protein